MNYLIIKSLHIIFVVSWFAGLFYIVRLFIYHREAQEFDEYKKDILSKQFKLMEKRLWYIITTPAMILSVIFGTLMIVMQPAFLLSTWLQIKLILVFLLLIYHFYCQIILNQMKYDVFRWTSSQLRIWNEIATLFLVMIVFIVVLKQSLQWITASLSFVLLTIILMIFIQIYKKIRNKNDNNFNEKD